MRLTQKLLRRLNRVFRKTGAPVIALRVDSKDGSRLLWTVADSILTLTPAAGNPVAVDLMVGTIQTLATLLAGTFRVSYVNPDVLGLSPCILIDGSGDTFASNGNVLSGYTDWHYAFLDAASVEMDALVGQIARVPLEMQTNTADGEWLDRLGAIYSVPRLPSELDLRYGPRIIAEVLRPRCNNVAMEILIQQSTGQTVTVSDATVLGAGFPQHNGAVLRNGTYRYTSTPSRIYGLFDVVIGYDLLSGTDPTGFSLQVRALIERLRAAGTHLRALSLSGSSLSDTVPPPRDGADSLVITKTYRHDGSITYAARVPHQPLVLPASLSGSIVFPA